MASLVFTHFRSPTLGSQSGAEASRASPRVSGKIVETMELPRYTTTPYPNRFSPSPHLFRDPLQKKERSDAEE